jgi:transcription elongation factor, mitochondrial
LDEILDLETFGVAVLEKFCDSIVNEQKKVIATNKAPKVSAQFLSPTMSNSAKNITSCVSVHITVNTVAWTRLELSENQPTAVTNWDMYKIDDKKLTLADLIQVVLYLDRLIPVADVYIFETPLVAQQTAPGSPVQININVQKSQITSMIALVLANRTNHMDINETDGKDQTISAQQSVFFLKQYLTSRLFRILVGTERVSNQAIVMQLLRTHYNTDDQLAVLPEVNCNVQREINVPMELRKKYDELGRGDNREPRREYLGQSLLTGLTFIRLCVIKCAESLSIINSRKK